MTAKLNEEAIEVLKDIVEYRSGPFMARFPEDANVAVIYKERLPELFVEKKEEVSDGK